jgi:NAD-dependent DNA ligase
MTYVPKTGHYAIAIRNFLAYLTQHQSGSNDQRNRINSCVVTISPGDYFLISQTADPQNYPTFPFKIIYHDVCYDVNRIDSHNFIFSSVSEILKNKSFAITGKGDYDRLAYERLIVLNGGQFKTGITKNLDYLIVGNLSQSIKSKTLKIQKALEKNIKIITTNHFLSMLR